MFPWFSFLTYAVITSVTPGPNNIFSMANGNRLGFRRALPFNLGVWTGFSVVMLLCTAFCSLAWHTFRSSGELQQSESKNGFVSGLLLQFVNPKIYIYCIVSMEAYIFPYYQQQPLVLAAFALLLAFIGFLFTLLWSAFGSAFQRLFSHHAKVVNSILALLLVYCAISLFFS